MVHEKEEETTEREEEDEEEEEKSSDEGLLLQAHHAMERMEEFVHKVRISSVHLSHTHINFAAETQLTHHKHRLSLYVEGHMVRLNR